MKVTVILIGIVASAFVGLAASAAVGSQIVTPKLLEPAGMMLSGAFLIALGSAVRRFVP